MPVRSSRSNEVMQLHAGRSARRSTVDLRSPRNERKVSERPRRGAVLSDVAPPARARSIHEPGINPATFDYETHVNALARSGVTLEVVRRRLTSEFGLSPSEADEVVKAAEMLQQVCGDRALAEMWTELSLLVFFTKDYFSNFAAIESNPELAAKRPTCGDRDFIMRNEVLCAARELTQLSAHGVFASGLRASDLFSRERVQHDTPGGVSPWEKAEVVRWLSGPFAKVSTPAELLEVLNQFKEIAHQERWTEVGDGDCAVLNPKACSALRQHGLYTVVMGTNVGALGAEHVFLRFFPLQGSHPIDVDYSFNQFVSVDNKVSGPVAAFHDEIGQLMKQHGGRKANARYFDGEALLPSCAAMSSAVVREVESKLKGPIPPVREEWL